jgi:hypothetical protein
VCAELDAARFVVRKDERGERRLGRPLRSSPSRRVEPELRSGARRAERSSSGPTVPVVQHRLRRWCASTDHTAGGGRRPDGSEGRAETPARPRKQGRAVGRSRRPRVVHCSRLVAAIRRLAFLAEQHCRPARCCRQRVVRVAATRAPASSKSTQRFKGACYARRCRMCPAAGESRALWARGERSTKEGGVRFLALARLPPGGRARRTS